MRKGYDPKIVLNEDGQIVAIATGADATTEHECGSKPMLAALCSPPQSDEALIQQLKLGHTVEYPNLLEVKRISRAPKELRWLDFAAPEPQAIFGLSSLELHYVRDELGFPSERAKTEERNLAAAWDERSFAIRVRGANYVEAVREFYRSMLEGHVAFGGSFFKRPNVHLSGVILVNTRHLTEEDNLAICEAQVRYESGLRLKARDESGMLMHQLSKLSGIQHLGFLWPMWQDKSESTVIYGLNPMARAKADYLGPYTKAQLIDWATAKCTYHLRREKAAA